MNEEAETATYRDGVEAERCATCRTLLRDKANRPMVSIRQEDAEELACFLFDYVDCPEVWAEQIQRLERVCGLTIAQMKAKERQHRVSA